GTATAAHVAVAPAALVVLERSVRDRGRPHTTDGPAGAVADVGLVVGTGRGVGAADGLVIRERTAAHNKASPCAILDAATKPEVDEDGGVGAAAIAAVPGD